MPAILAREMEPEAKVLLARNWSQSVGPTAFSFLIPVFLIAVVMPALCIICIRKRQGAPPVAPVEKKPALQRGDAMERLKSVTEVSNVICEPRSSLQRTIEEAEKSTARVSTSERECAICLSTLQFPSSPEPAKLSDAPAVAKAPPIKSVSLTEPEDILKLKVCGHEFHAECLVSWFVLRKTSCPICRAEYYSNEAMQSLEEELQTEAPRPTSTPRPAQTRTPMPSPLAGNWLHSIYQHRLVSGQTATASQAR